MNQIPLEKLNKEELMMLIREEMWIKEPNTTAIYFRERSKKNTEKTDAVNEQTYKNLEAQGEIGKKFNKCTDYKKKLKFLEKLGALKKEYSSLSKQWDKLYKQGNALFEECYGKKNN